MGVALEKVADFVDGPEPRILSNEGCHDRRGLQRQVAPLSNNRQNRVFVACDEIRRLYGVMIWVWAGCDVVCLAGVCRDVAFVFAVEPKFEVRKVARRVTCACLSYLVNDEEGAFARSSCEVWKDV